MQELFSIMNVNYYLWELCFKLLQVALSLHYSKQPQDFKSHKN